MSARRGKAKEEADQDVESSGCFGVAIKTLAVVALILYVAVLLISRTDGFRFLVEERLQERWSWPVRLERAWLSPGLDLVLEGIASDGFSGTGAGVTFGELRVGWNLWGFLWPRRDAVHALNAERVTASFARDSQGAWQPAFFVQDALMLAAWAGVQPDAERIGVGVVDYRPGTSITLRGCDLLWWRDATTLHASVQGLTFSRDEAPLLDARVRMIRIEAEQTFFNGHTRGPIAEDYLWFNDRPVQVE